MDENIELEKMVDKTSLWQVVSDLVDICYAKDAHIRSNWQDNKLAKGWRDAGDELYGILDKVR